MHAAIINPSGIQFIRDSLTHFPRADRAAANAVGAWLHTQGVALSPDDIDVAILHYRFHQGHCIGQVIQRMSLTQAVLSNWQGESDNDLIGAAIGSPWAGEPPPAAITLVEQLPDTGVLDNSDAYQIYNGLFRRSSPQTYGPQSHIAIHAETFQRFIWTLDFHKPYKAMLDQYWAKSLDSYQKAAKISFIAASNRQTLNGSLSTAGKRLTWQVAGLEHTPDWPSLGLATRSEPVIEAAPLNVYGYPASDLLCLKNNATGLTLLYIPGNAAPLHEFANTSLMKHWLARQCQDPHKRQALLNHFAPTDRPDGLSYSGLATALYGLGQYPKPHYFDANDHPGFATSGIWHPDDMINYKAASYSPRINGDVFEALALRQKKRSYQDADYLINSDASVIRERWRGYLDSAVNLLAPLAAVVVELAPLFAIGGAVQLGLGLDQALHGKHLQDRAGGAEQALFGLLNAAPLLHSAATADTFIYRFKNNRFVAPQRFNDQIGYPLSPMDPPRLPSDALAAHFHLPAPAPALADADPWVAAAVKRIGQQSATRITFQGVVDGYLNELIYDIEQNNFILASDFNTVEPQRFIAPQPPARNMRRLWDEAPPATDLERTRTLKALGIDLDLPLDIAALTAAPTQAVPRLISSLWVGNQLIPGELLNNLARNARILEGSQYRYQLLLSNASPAAYAQNLSRLQALAPNLNIETLESHAVYQQFSQSKYFAQYQSAIDGNAGQASNFASAADILRYRVLHHQGGLYMDVDDALLIPGELRRSPYAPESIVNEAIDAIDLQTTPQGLLVSGIVSNEFLDMDGKFNNSLIASHAGNPTLEAISEEIYQRYQHNQDFYHRRPDPELDYEAFARYAVRLSQLTGPALLNDVIDRELPTLRIARETQVLGAAGILNWSTVVDRQALLTAWRELIPLDRVATISSSASWART